MKRFASHPPTKGILKQVTLGLGAAISALQPSPTFFYIDYNIITFLFLPFSPSKAFHVPLPALLQICEFCPLIVIACKYVYTIHMDSWIEPTESLCYLYVCFHGWSFGTGQQLVCSSLGGPWLLLSVNIYLKFLQSTFLKNYKGKAMCL